MIALACALASGIMSAGGWQPDARPQSGPPPVALTAEELHVVNAALDATVKPRLPATLKRTSTLAVAPDVTLAACADVSSPLCIHERTVATLGRLLGDWDTTLADAFTARNRSASAVTHVRKRFAIVSADELESIGPDAGWWNNFERRFGRVVLVQFSTPAISGDRAAILVRLGCGSLCGTAWLVTLQQRGERFRVRNVRVLAKS